MRIKLLALLLVIFCSCGSKRSEDSSNSDSVIRIDLLSEPKSTVTKLSEFAADVDYIPLQTTKNSLLGEFAKKIVYVDNKIYINNSGLGGEIMCFNIYGKFLFKLDNTGRGPEEYTSITDFDVSSDNKFLTLLSSLNHKLLVYGISETGITFQKSINLKDPAPYSVSIVPETGKIFLAIAPWRGTEPALSLLINTNGDTIHFKPNCYKYKMARKINYRASNESIAYSIGNNVCFKETFSDTVFYVDAKDNIFKPRMIFDSHGTLITPEMRGGSETPGNNTNWIASIFETSRFVFYWYGTRVKRNRILFDKKTNNKYKLDTEIIIETIAGIPRKEEKITLRDDLSGGPYFNIEFLDNYCSGGKLFSLIDAITLKNYVAGEDFKNARVSNSKKAELNKLADSLKETDNPVLILVTPKD
jgi:hypothetical protein